MDSPYRRNGCVCQQQSDDWVLRRTAETCSGMCRRIGHIGRIGGEEWAILLQGCELVAAARLANGIRSRLSSIDSRESGQSFRGLGKLWRECHYDLPLWPAELMSHADLMLYRGQARTPVPILSAAAAAPQPQ